MRLLVALTVVLLTGCAGQKVVRVEVPVATLCINVADIPQRPQFEADTLTRDVELGEKVKRLLIDRKQRIMYERELEALMIRCSKQ